MIVRSSHAAACCLVLGLLVAGPPVSAKADADRREARASGTCSTGATSKLRLRSRGGRIHVEFVVNPRRGRATWRFAVVHERRVTWRATVRAHGSVRIRRSVGDLDGPDRVRVRASGPRGITCEASATLRA
jgi:hypothetical protein